MGRGMCDEQRCRNMQHATRTWDIIIQAGDEKLSRKKKKKKKKKKKNKVKRVKRLASLGTTDIEVETWTERDDQLLKAMLLKY